MAQPNNFHCQDSVACPGGNCIGCRNGQVWCQDPRCQGYCPNCNTSQEYNDITTHYTFAILIMVFLLILFAVWICYGNSMTYYYVPNYALDQYDYATPMGEPIFL